MLTTPLPLVYQLRSNVKEEIQRALEYQRQGLERWIEQYAFIGKGAVAYLSANQAIPTGAATQIAFNTIVYDDFQCYATTGQFTVPAGVVWSKVRVSAFLNVDNTVLWNITVRKNAAQFIGGGVLQIPVGVQYQSMLSSLFTVIAGDVLSVYASQASGVNKNLTGGATNPCWMQVEVFP